MTEEWRSVIGFEGIYEVSSQGRVRCISYINRWKRYLVLPGGMTFGDWARPQLTEIYETKRMPRLLPMLEDRSRGKGEG